VAVVAPAANILGSWIEAAQVLEIEVVQVFPSRWHAEAIGRFRVSEDMAELADADVVVTDCWPAGAKVPEYRVTARVLDSLRAAAVFIPCPPVTRGEEVSAEAMVHPRCVVVPAKAFLLHAQNALLEWSFGIGPLPQGARESRG
jgi:ornithine carbamoyltransferase